LPTFLAPLPGEISFRRMSGFLYRQEVRNTIDHPAVFRRINNRYGLMYLAKAQACNTGFVAFQPTVLALNQRDLYLFWRRHDLVS